MEFIDIDTDEEELRNFRKKYDELISEPYNYIGIAPGKKIREQMITICNYWAGITNEELQIIKDIVSKLHNMSLLLDDIQDNSYIRRGVPAAHIVYGSARTIASVNHVSIVLLPENVPKHLRQRIRNLITIACMRALKGQIMDTYWRDHFICPSEEAYVDMICKKTGCIFQLMYSLTSEFNGKKDKNFDTFCDIISTHFQIVDDYCNLKSEAYYEKKGFCDDLTEGKFSYPIICALQNHPEDRRILEVLKMHTNDDAIKRECLELIEKYGGFEDTRNKLASLREKLCDEIDKLDGQPIKDEIMELLFLHAQ